MRLLKSFVLAAAMMVAISSTAQAQQLCPNPTAKVDSFDFLVDYSGSMMMHYGAGDIVYSGDAIVGKEKIEMAKGIMLNINSKLAPLSYTAGIHTFSPYDQLLAQGPYNKEMFAAAVDTLRSDHDTFHRMTAVGDGFMAVSPAVQAMPGRSALILVSDGMNNRGTSPVEQARAIYAANPNAVIHIISLADSAEGKAQLDQIAALNPNTVYANGAELYTNEQALNQFIYDVFYNCGETIVLRSVQFALDSAALDSTAKGILREAASMLKNQSGTIYVDGHTCSLGTDQYNQRLSERRANSVRSYLIEQGVPSNRLIARGFGEARPKYSNATEETRRLNRRVELGVE